MRGVCKSYHETVTDFPDWQSYPNAQSDNLYPAFTQTLAPGTHSTAVIPALSWSSVTIAVTVTAGAGQIQLNHFANAAGTEQIDSDNWPVNTTTRLVVRSPLRGKYIRLDTIVTSPADLAGSFWGNFLSASSDRISFPVSSQNLSAYDSTLAASASITYNSGEITAGPALFYVKPYDASGKLAVALHCVDELGNPGDLIADFGTPAALTQQLITVPDKILQVEIANTDTAAAHTYDFSLTVPPR